MKKFEQRATAALSTEEIARPVQNPARPDTPGSSRTVPSGKYVHPAHGRSAARARAQRQHTPRIQEKGCADAAPPTESPADKRIQTPERTTRPGPRCARRRPAPPPRRRCRDTRDFVCRHMGLLWRAAHSWRDTPRPTRARPDPARRPAVRPRANPRSVAKTRRTPRPPGNRSARASGRRHRRSASETAASAQGVGGSITVAQNGTQPFKHLVRRDARYALVNRRAALVTGGGASAAKHAYRIAIGAVPRRIGRPVNRDPRFAQGRGNVQWAAVHAHHCGGASRRVDQPGESGGVRDHAGDLFEERLNRRWAVENQRYAEFPSQKAGQRPVVIERPLLGS